MRKNSKIKFDRYTALGIFVLVSVILNQYVNFVKYWDPLEILWFCDTTAFILGIGLILKNRTMITLTLVSTIPAQFMWIVDFFMEAAGQGAGRTSELYTFGPVVFWLSVNLHAILIPISFYATWKLGFDKKALPWILIYIFFLLNSTYFFTPISENRNCVFHGCDDADPGSGYATYFLLHSLLYWLVSFSISFFIQRKAFSFLEERKAKKLEYQTAKKSWEY